MLNTGTSSCSQPQLESHDSLLEWSSGGDSSAGLINSAPNKRFLVRGRASRILKEHAQPAWPIKKLLAAIKKEVGRELAGRRSHGLKPMTSHTFGGWRR